MNNVSQLPEGKSSPLLEGLGEVSINEQKNKSTNNQINNQQ